MNWRSWESWAWDIPTLGWAAWALFFAVWETYTGINHEGQMLTDHLRPVFLNSPPVWFLAFGLWAWLGVHLLAPTLETWLARAVGEVTSGDL